MHTPPKKSKAERDLATACGGQRTTAQLHDGREVRVFVRQLPLRLCDRYIELALAGDEQRRLELCIGESPEWEHGSPNPTARQRQIQNPKSKIQNPSDRFTTDSQCRLLDLADELNFRIALPLIERKKNTIGGLEPFLKRLYATQATMMETAFKTMVDSAVSSLTASLSSAGLTPNSGTTSASTSSPSPSPATPPITTPATASPPPATS